MAEDVNAEALRFVRESAIEMVLAAAFRMRLETFFHMGEDEETLQSWFEEHGYMGVTLAEIEKATLYYEAHHVGFWSGHYTLTAGKTHFGELSINDEEVRLNGVVVDAIAYDANKLTWGASAAGSRGSLTFATVGDAREKDFKAGYFAKQARGTIQREATSEVTTVLGNTFGVSFGASAGPAVSQ